MDETAIQREHAALLLLRRRDYEGIVCVDVQLRREAECILQVHVEPADRISWYACTAFLA